MSKHKYLLDNGYDHVHEEEGGYVRDFYHKKFDGYHVTVTISTNYYGGHETVDVHNDWRNLPAPKRPIYTMKSPGLTFDTTGYSDYAALEKMIAEDIIPNLRKWAIEGL